jgi:hypothetical protein
MKRKVNTYSTSHREFQRRKDKTKNKRPRNKEKKHKNNMNNSASFTPVQGPSTEACILVTSLSQLSH